MSRILLFLFLILFFASLFSSTSPRNIKNHGDLDVAVFELGMGGYWYGKEKPNLVVCFRGFHPFLSEETNIRAMEKIFTDHEILYVDLPWIGISEHASFEISLEDHLLGLYQSLLRYKKWKTIGFVGTDYGAVLQSGLFFRLQCEKYRCPDYIIQIDGFRSADGMILHSFPWWTQAFPKYRKNDSALNYKHLDIPLLLVHTKNNTKIPFIESVLLYHTLRKNTLCRFVPIFGHQDYPFLSRENVELIRSHVPNLMNRVITN